LCIRKIIGDVIDIAHGLLGDMKDRATQVGKTVLPVEQILDEAVSILAQEARNKGLLIIKGYSNHSPSFLLSERKKILRIVLNILSNAIKYSEGGKEKRIWINTILDETRLEISIKDEGYGIADIRNIFRPFNGASAPNNAKVRSTGLGLYSTRILVEEDHGGVLIIESEKGRGTTVRCVFTAHME
jgi:signal transduction histidine kinase